MSDLTSVTFAWLGDIAVRTDEIQAVTHRIGGPARVELPGSDIYLRGGHVVSTHLLPQMVLDELVKANP